MQDVPISLKKLELQSRESLKLRLYCGLGVKKPPDGPDRKATAKKRVILRFQTVRMKAM